MKENLSEKIYAASNGREIYSDDSNLLIMILPVICRSEEDGAIPM